MSQKLLKQFTQCFNQGLVEGMWCCPWQLLLVPAAETLRGFRPIWSNFILEISNLSCLRYPELFIWLLAAIFPWYPFTGKSCLERKKKREGVGKEGNTERFYWSRTCVSSGFLKRNTEIPQRHKLCCIATNSDTDHELPAPEWTPGTGKSNCSSNKQLQPTQCCCWMWRFHSC